jgi:proteasome lid subunit RPN8/RPN11
MDAHVTSDVLAVIARAAARAYPREGCGVLGGARRSAGIAVALAIELDNIAAPGDRFAIDAVAFARAEWELRRRSLSFCGFFHSHTDGTATPSDADAAAAWPGSLQIIVPVARGVPGPPRAYYPSRGRLQAAVLLADPSPLPAVEGRAIGPATPPGSCPTSLRQL